LRDRAVYFQALRHLMRWPCLRGRRRRLWRRQ
jgi:hypothetical protein